MKLPGFLEDLLCAVASVIMCLYFTVLLFNYWR